MHKKCLAYMRIGNIVKEKDDVILFMSIIKKTMAIIKKKQLKNNDYFNFRHVALEIET